MADSPMIVIAAGGTGGHMFPARAFADALAARGARTALVTDPRGRRYTEGFPAVDTLILPVTNADEGGLGGKLKAALTVAKSMGLTGPFLKRLAADAVVGFGGYPTFPVLTGAGKAAVFIHEQNAVLGRVNRLFQGKAVTIASGFTMLEGLEHPAKHVVTGNPVRAPIVEARAIAYSPPTDGSIRILVTGGSQGARILGDVVPDALAGLSESLRMRLFVSHQVREEQCDRARAVYSDAGIEAEVWPFFKDMADRLGRAHLVIGRAGASTVSETAVVGRPAILVPLGIATNDHQTFNARALAAAGAADVIAEGDFNAKDLGALLAIRLNDPAGLARRAAAAAGAGKPDAADALAGLVLAHLAKRASSAAA